MSKFYKLFAFIASIFLFNSIQSQLNPQMYVRGDINSWGTDPMTFNDLGTDTWVASVISTADNSNSGFKFDNNNSWSGCNWARGANVSLNTITDWYICSGPNGTFNQINGKYYTFIFRDEFSYNNSQGYVFEFDAKPVDISNVTGPVGGIDGVNTDIEVTLSAPADLNERVYVRYTIDGWVTSDVVEGNPMGLQNIIIQIPGQSAGTTVEYYVFTSVSGISDANADLATITFDNNSGANYSYFVCDAAPTSQSSNFSSSNLSTNTATISWTRGNGDNVLVLARSGSAVSTDPTNNTSYVANAAFGSGDAIGSSYVVYKGTGTTVDLTNLSSSTTYHFGVYEYNDNCIVHNNSQLTGSLTTTTNNNVATTGSSSNWNDASAWNTGVVPTAGQNVTISHDVTVNENTASLATLTVETGITLTVGAYNLEVAGLTDINGTIDLQTNAIVNIDGEYDATSGNTLFSGSARLQMSGTVTSLGTFTRSTGTVEYDGGSQTVLGMSASSSSSYYNLEIDGSGTKSLAGTSKIYGNLILTASDFDIGGRTIYPVQDITRTSGNLIASSAANISYSTGSSHGICAFSDEDITIKTIGTTSKIITTTGNIDCKTIYLSNPNSTFLVDGETINIDIKLNIEEGTFNITSGTVNVNENTLDACLLVTSTAMLDIDAGTLNIGASSNDDSEIDMSNGTIDISGGTLNINDELDIADGTFTQTGGTVNIKSYVGSYNGTSTSKFDMDAGTLNLTAGTLRINGQTTISASSNPAMRIASGVTVNSNSGHTILIQSNNTTSNDEDIYLELNGKDIGSIDIDLTGHEVYLLSDVSVLGDVTLTAGDLQASSARSLTMNGSTQAITFSSGSISGTGVGAGNDLTLNISSGSTTSFNNANNLNKFFNINVNASSTLDLSSGILCQYGTFTVDGTLKLSQDGYVESDSGDPSNPGKSPNYSSTSLLCYHYTGNYNRNHEWISTSGAGYPYNVTVSQGSINLGHLETGTARQLAGDLTILSGTGFYMDYGSDDMTQSLTVNGSLVNNGTLSLSGIIGGDLVVKGDFSQNGTFNHNSRAVTFNGSSVQNINTTGSNVTFGYLTINNSSGVVLGDPITVNGGLTLTTGDITSDATNKLTIGSGGTLSGGSDDSHVIGPMDYVIAGTSVTTLPVGDGTRYRPVYITPVSGGSTYTAEYFSSAYEDLTCNPGDIDHVAPGIYWDIDNNGGAAAKVGLSWNATINVDVPADMILAHWNSSTSTWEKMSVDAEITASNGSGSAVPTDGRVSATVSSFSPFNLGSGSGNNPLPVDLLSFTADCSHDIVDINFSVISQVNNDYFLVEKSKDAVEWEEVGTLEGAGTTNSQMDYSMVDGAADHGLSYYRLTQVDYDGTSKTFAPVSSSCESLGSGLPIEVYPNPMINEVTFELDLDEYQGNEVYYTILDARGSIVLRDNMELSRGFNKQTIDVQNLPKGVYILRFNNTRDHISETRIVKR